MNRDGETLRTVAERGDPGEVTRFREAVALAAMWLWEESPACLEGTGRVRRLHEAINARVERGLPLARGEVDRFACAQYELRLDALAFGVRFGVAYGRWRRLPPPERLRRAVAFAVGSTPRAVNV